MTERLGNHEVSGHVVCSMGSMESLGQAELDRRAFFRLTAAATLVLVVTKNGSARAEPQPTPQDKMERSPGSDRITLFLCGDVMTGRGIDQVMPPYR